MPRIGTTASVLFSLPEYECAQFEFLHLVIHGLMKTKDPIYAQIQEGDFAETMPITQNTMPSGETVQTQPISQMSRVEFQWDDIRCCNVGAFADVANKIADERIVVVMRHFFDTFHRTCDAAGTATDLGGAPLTFEAHLQSFSKIEFRFDKDGTPRMPQLVAHPDTAAKLAKLPPWTPEQQVRWDQMIDQKRKEYFAKRRHRQLC